MATQGAEHRPAAVLGALGLTPAGRIPSGRYQSSLPVRPGVRYWATSQPRSRRDMLGVQFYGEGRSEAARLASALESRGFKRRNPQTGQATFAKPVPYAADDGVNRSALEAVRRELDALLAGLQVVAPAQGASSGMSFREFMLASPWADIEIELPERSGGERDISFLFEH